MRDLSVAVVGASGYTGAELLRLLSGHPRVAIAGAYARQSAGSALADVFPQFAGVLDLPVEAFEPDAVARAAKVAFAALPHGDSAVAVAQLVARGVRVIDLSADFRLRSPDTYRDWYGGADHAHPEPALLGEAVYGLPERHRAELRAARVCAAPGCYPTAAILAVAPLLAAGLVSPRGMVIDAKSGASGGGRSPALAFHLPEVGEGVRAYKVAGEHRHTPEIEQELSAAAGADVRVTFSPHLVPMSRGILSCVYADPTDPSRPADDYLAALRDAYRDEPFITVLGPGKLPDTAFVRGSNRAHVAVRWDARANKVLAMAAIDNLGKGASGQAVQCLNVMMGWDETEGLGGAAMFP